VAEAIEAIEELRASAAVATAPRPELSPYLDKVRARASVLFGDAHAHQAELGELREQLTREAVLPVPRRRVRLDVLAREIAGERLDLALLRGELEVHEKSLVSR